MKKRQGGFLISKIKTIGGRKFDKILQQKNIDAFNGAQGKILYVLWQGGKMTATEISKKSGLAKTTLTAMLARMQEQGLVHIVENAADRRSALVCLTEKETLPLSGRFFIFGHSPSLLVRAPRAHLSTCQSLRLLLATRKRVLRVINA